MFDRCDGEQKFDQYLQERTAAQFGDTHDESFVYEVEAEKQYVERLKSQREKVSSYSFRSKLSTPSMTSFSKISKRKTSKSAKKTVLISSHRNHLHIGVKMQEPGDSLAGINNL